MFERRGGALYKYPKNLGGDMEKMKRKEIAILLVAGLVAGLVAVIVIGIFGLPAEITSSSGAITYYTNR